MGSQKYKYENQKVKNVVRFLWKRARYRYTVDEIALEIGTSERTLRRIVKKHLSTGLSQIINSIRIYKTILCYQNNSECDLYTKAMENGFTDEFRFNFYWNQYCDVPLANIDHYMNNGREILKIQTRVNLFQILRYLDSNDITG